MVAVFVAAAVVRSAKSRMLLHLEEKMLADWTVSLTLEKAARLTARLTVQCYRKEML